MLDISFSLDVVMVPCQERQLDSLMQKLSGSIWCQGFGCNWTWEHINL